MNYDQEIEKKYHPENFQESDDIKIDSLLVNAENFDMFMQSVEDEGFNMSISQMRDYWDDYVSRHQ